MDRTTWDLSGVDRTTVPGVFDPGLFGTTMIPSCTNCGTERNGTVIDTGPCAVAVDDAPAELEAALEGEAADVAADDTAADAPGDDINWAWPNAVSLRPPLPVPRGRPRGLPRIPFESYPVKSAGEGDGRAENGEAGFDPTEPCEGRYGAACITEGLTGVDGPDWLC